MLVVMRRNDEDDGRGEMLITTKRRWGAGMMLFTQRRDGALSKAGDEAEQD